MSRYNLKQYRQPKKGNRADQTVCLCFSHHFISNLIDLAICSISDNFYQIKDSSWILQPYKKKKNLNKKYTQFNCLVLIGHVWDMYGI